MNKYIPLWVLAIIFATYTIIFAIAKNFEFLIYIGVTAIVAGLVALGHKKLNFSQISLWGFTLWGLLHMLGGSIYIGVTKLYDFMIFQFIGAPYFILKYDQVVHFFCYLVIAMLLTSAIKSRLKMPKVMIWVSIVLMAIGVGALNEIVEFGAVAFLGNTGVGDYYNTALDLVFNLLGAMLGTFIELKNRKKPKDL